VLPPTILPKMDFREGIPDDHLTMVVVPALLANEEEVSSLLGQIELHYLRNPDAGLYFALLTDFADGTEQITAKDKKLLDQAVAGIQALNERYQRESAHPFYLLHRERRWNPSEGLWMGWERKRGKLEEFNRLVLGDTETSFVMQIGDLEIVPEIRYVITLDADTVLPKGDAQRLVGALAHPLNHAEFDPQTGAVVSGYTVLQPRTEIKPAATNMTLFTHIFAGDTGLDLYTHAVSDVYQDLFGEGSYVGKGIYDLAAFSQSVSGRVPENALLSHDLFEGILGRAGLVTDITVFEDYPAGYLEYTERLHRWIRGDWQLLPWLLPPFPRLKRGKTPYSLKIVDRWKILDNLRRSLLAPALLALLILGWLWLPGSAILWTLLGILTTGVPIFTSLVNELRHRQTGILGGVRISLWRQTQLWVLNLIFMPYEAYIALDAILTTLVRLFITRRHLLQWRTAAATARLFGRRTQSQLHIWSHMLGSSALTLGIAALVIIFDVSRLPVAAPFLLAWLMSPRVAYLISLPVREREETLNAEQLQQLRRLGRRTWWYFEQFIGPEDHWLPPDHFQESPRGLVAHRTSPTNIGLDLLSTMAAFDLGYTGFLDLVLRLRDSFRSLDQLERHRGHILNWYDTRTLEPLVPRYVSTVDSGNFAAALLAVRQGILGLEQTKVLRWARWQAVLDTMGVLAEIVDSLEAPSRQGLEALESHLAAMREQVLAVQGDKAKWIPLLSAFIEERLPKLEQRLVALIEAKDAGLDPTKLRHLHVWLTQVRNDLSGMQRELDILLPWLPAFGEPPALLVEAAPGSELAEAWQAVQDALPPDPRLEQLSTIWRAAEIAVSRLVKQLDDYPAPAEELKQAQAWCDLLMAELRSTPVAAAGVFVSIDNLSKRADDWFQGMDFGFLYDRQRRVFRIGYNVDAEQADPNYYDLLASEARTASLIAIAKGDVPEQHWLHLGRPLTQINGKRALLAWTGSMFEYLMPILLLRQYPNTLLDQSVTGAVERQIAYGRERDVPWGISESGYFRFDNQLSYQYRGFGVPGLGLRRGLADDLVVAPYASLLALPIRPQTVMQNIDRFVELDMLGQYGLYEAIDYTPTRLALGQDYAIVRSFMAHHQGMIFLSLANYLDNDLMVHRFHSDPRVQSIELLLQEQIPHFAPVEKSPEIEAAGMRPEQGAPIATPWQVPHETPFPEAHLISNGRYGVLVTNAGAGYSRWQDIDLTRWRADTTLDDWGTWIYVQDIDAGDLWSAGYQPCGPATQRETTFYPYQADFRSTANQIVTRMEITVPPEADLEIRRVSLTNQGDQPRRLLVSSYGELVLAARETDQRHPAFNKLFIESEYRSGINGLFFHRRPRSGEESPIYLLHVLVTEKGQEPTGAYESDRAAFIGRGSTPRNPAAFNNGSGLTNTVGTVLDPIMALGQVLELAPHTTVQIAFLTIAAESREESLDLARRYRDWARINRAFDQARSQSEIEMRELELSSEELQRIEQLLSVLLYPSPALRAEPDILAANRKGQPGLWSFAISGDYPILLVRVATEDDTALVHELLRAHIYWRRRGLKIDLVIMNEKEAGYAQELQGQLNRLLRRLNSEGWLNQRGGIFLIGGGALSQEDHTLLLTVARAVLDGGKGSLAGQLSGLRTQPTRLPGLVATRARDPESERASALERPTDLQFDNGLGGFSPDGREYVIYLKPGQWTPAPWINVIANPHSGCLISEAGGGYTWSVNSGENRLTPWRNDPVQDTPGEALYLRDEETAAVWSPTPLPAGGPAPYLIRHGAGYTVFEHHSHQLKQQLRIFVVRDAPVKIVQLRLENAEDRVRRVTATYYAEWVLGVHRDAMQPYIVPEFVEDHYALLARNNYNTEFAQRVAFVAANQAPHGVTADRTEFLGRLRGVERPAALERVGLSSTVRAGLDPCAAVQIHLDLEPGQSREVFFLVGEAEDRDTALQQIERYLEPEQVRAAWEASNQFWDDLLSVVTVNTPDPAMDVMLNRWLFYQDLSCRVWGRSAFYQSSGAYGYRDQLQDIMALTHAAPELAREHILRAAGHQFEAGDVLHWWHPPSGRGVRTRISDDLLWLPFVTAHYVSATGDRGILQEKIPFLVAPPLKPEEKERYGNYSETEETYPLYEHCRRALKQGSTEGPHGLPLMKTGDWNDGMNHVGVEGRGESVWLGWFLHATLVSFIPLCQHVEDDQQADKFRRQAGALRKALAEHAWDGKWYVRAYYDDGSPLGSSQNRECKIDSIAQSWAVLSEAGGWERASEAMQAVYEWLVQPEDRLLLLFTPPFDKTARDPGYIKGYPPGVRENGGQYTHAALWAVWAYARLGQGDRAEKLFRMLNPIYHSDEPAKAARYHVEPYVVAADVYGEPPHTGRGGWTWYTGSAGWMYRVGVEAILGVQRNGDRLRIEPCIPRGWPGYELIYRFGQTGYQIRVDNPDRVSWGVREVTLDGERLPDGNIPLVDDGESHEVHVRMGDGAQERVPGQAATLLPHPGAQADGDDGTL
jgi:cyclic beta-1,2-glucan synthetase